MLSLISSFEEKSIKHCDLAAYTVSAFVMHHKFDEIPIFPSSSSVPATINVIKSKGNYIYTPAAPYISNKIYKGAVDSMKSIKIPILCNTMPCSDGTF